jgi:xanthine dehydrogenase accessory factor
MLNILETLTEAIKSRQPVALATIIDVQGASPARVGFKLLVWPDGKWQGNVGGGKLEKRIRQAAQEVLVEGRARTLHYSLHEEGPDAIGMLCGGEVKVFIEPYMTKPILLIVGGGHIGQPLAEMGRIIGYDVQVVDVLPELADRPLLDSSTITADTYVVIITEDHVTDESALRDALPTPAAYIGVIGSQRKTATIMQHLHGDGFTDDQLARVRAPIGLDLGGREPAQIALAILSEIEMVRHGGRGRPRSETMKNTLRVNTKENENPV